MELKKTTILSAFVLISGILAEIIFRDTLSKSFVGVALSVVLAVVVLAAFYFTVDGVYYLESLHREEAARQQKEYEQRVYSVLNEQLKFQKAVYSEVKNLQQQLSEQQAVLSQVSVEYETLPEQYAQYAAPQQIPAEPGVTREDLMQMLSAIDESTRQMLSEVSGQTAQAVAEINDHTMQAAKIVAKYVGKSAEEIKQEVRR